MAGISHYFKSTIEIINGSGTWIIHVVNQLFMDLLVGWSEAKKFFAIFGDGQPGSSKIRCAILDTSEYLAEILCGDHFEFDTKIIGKQFGQIVFKTGRAIRAFVIGGRTVTGEYYKLTFTQDSIERVVTEPCGYDIEYNDNCADGGRQSEKYVTVKYVPGMNKAALLHRCTRPVD